MKPRPVSAVKARASVRLLAPTGPPPLLERAGIGRVGEQGGGHLPGPGVDGHADGQPRDRARPHEVEEEGLGVAPAGGSTSEPASRANSSCTRGVASKVVGVAHRIDGQSGST